MDSIDAMLTALQCDPDDRVHIVSGDGCKASLRRSRTGDALYLMKIATDARSRGQGNASALLGAICEAADEHSVTMFLEVECQEGSGLDAAQLVDWYWRHGFRGTPAEMIREPDV